MHFYRNNEERRAFANGNNREDGHDACVRDEDPFAGGNGHAADHMRSGCGAEKRRWEAGSPAARRNTEVTRSSSAGPVPRLTCVKSRRQCAARLNNFARHKLRGKPHRGPNRGPFECGALSPAPRRRNRRGAASGSATPACRRRSQNQRHQNAGPKIAAALVLFRPKPPMSRTNVQAFPG